MESSFLTSYRSIPPEYNELTNPVVSNDDISRTVFEDAAIFLREGKHSRFYRHPATKYARYAFYVTNNLCYKIFHLLICILLLLLVFAETPGVGQKQLSTHLKKVLVIVHSSFEMIFLTIIAINLILHSLWYGWRLSLSYKQRRVYFFAILLVMFAEAITVMIRQENHFRISRALRPFFLIDTYLMVGVRRVLQQICNIILRIVEIMFLWTFFIALFALLGYLLLAQTDSDYFSSYLRSYISLFVLQTTANNPDVMMESYIDHPITPIFFVVYIIITVYFASNVLFAVMYSSFQEADTKKFNELLLHRRVALNRAFTDVCQNSDPKDKIPFRDFLQLIDVYEPRMPGWQVMCIFKELLDNKDPLHGQELGKLEFHRFYEVLDYKWEEVDDQGEKIQYFSRFHSRIKTHVEAIHDVVTWKWYKFIIGLLALGNLIFLIVYIIQIEKSDERFSKLHTVLPVSFAFSGFYIADILLNIIGHGPRQYFCWKIWNIIDLIIVGSSFICLCLELNPKYATLAIVRPIKLLRMIRMKQNFRTFVKTMVALVPRLFSTFILILTIYYVFAIFGMEFFSSKVYPGCCNSSWYGVRQYYSEPAPSTDYRKTTYEYYIISFDNILRSYMTLFILMVTNNWYIIMEGVSSQVKEHWLARIYFMLFNIIMLVVLQTIISFTVDAFRSMYQIQASIPETENNNEKKKTDVITLVDQDITTLEEGECCLEKSTRLNRCIKKCCRINLQPGQKIVGCRDYTKEDIHKDEIKKFMNGHENDSYSYQEKRIHLSINTAKETARDIATNTKKFLYKLP